MERKAEPLFIDTETCGLTGPVVTIQTKELNKKAQIHHVWKQPVGKTLDLITEICKRTVVGYNLVYDWFHLVKLYNILYCQTVSFPPSILYTSEHERKFESDWCLKPAGALDLLSYVRTGPLQRFMVPRSEKQSVIKLRRVHHSVAPDLLEYINNNLSLDSLYGAKSSISNVKGDFQDITIRFRSTLALKPLVKYLFNVETLDYPQQLLALMDDYKIQWRPWGNAWEPVIPYHIKYWHENPQYALDDVIYLEMLWNYFEPNCNSLNDQLAIAVGASRWRGFELDLPRLAALAQKSQEYLDGLTFNVNSQSECKKFIAQDDDLLKITFPDTDKRRLERFVKTSQNPDAIERVETVLKGRKAEKKLNILRKLIDGKRFFPNFNIVGTKSNRMSGSGGLNPQGIQRNPSLRQCFKFGRELSGGDFSGFEITIYDALVGDDVLRRELQRGLSFHGLFGEYMHGESYDRVVNSELYNRSKNGSFAYIYGADTPQLADTIGISEEQAQKGMMEFNKKYWTAFMKRHEIMDKFNALTQPRGPGTKVVWRDPPEYAESLLGFRRYFTLENTLVKFLYDTAENIDSILPNASGTCVRDATRGQQKVANSVRTSLYAACFNIQKHATRAAFNHLIQSTGAEICKAVQCAIWDLQPVGVHAWHVSTFNVHDEVMVVHREELTDAIDFVVQKTVLGYQAEVPLLKMEWKRNLKTWGDK